MQLRSNFRMTKTEWNRLVSQFVKPSEGKQRKRVTGRKRKTYEATVGIAKFDVRALTKSEARSMIKASLKPKVSRLPVGTILTEKII